MIYLNGIIEKVNKLKTLLSDYILAAENNKYNKSVNYVVYWKMIILCKQKSRIISMWSARVNNKHGQMSFMEKMPFKQNFKILRKLAIRIS